MKEIAPSLDKPIIWVRLRKSDLRELARVLTSGGGVLEVSADTCKFDSLDELLSFEEPVTGICLKRQLPGPSSYISVNLRAKSAFAFSVTYVSISAPSVDDLVLGLVARLDVFFRSRRIRVFDFPTVLFAEILAFTAGVGAVPFFLLDRDWRGWVSLPAMGIAFTASLLASLAQVFRKVPVRFRRERAAPINWRGGGWDLSKIVLAAIVGGIVTLTIQRIHTAPPGVSRQSIEQGTLPRGDAGSGQ